MWEKRGWEVGEGGEGGGRKEGREVGGMEREVGEEKFVKWKKTEDFKNFSIFQLFSWIKVKVLISFA
jgi:hypothetical protein